MERLLDSLRAPPPRAVPRALARGYLGSVWGGLFGLGLAAGGLSLSLAVVFFPRGILDDRALDREASRSPGRISAVEVTAAAEGRVNKQVVGAILRVGFSFAAAGVERAGSCLCTASAEMSPVVGASVEVEYLARDPAKARIRGCRSSFFGGWAVLLLALPAAGFALAALGLVARARRRRLLSHGLLSRARVVWVRASGVKVGGRARHEVELELTLDGAAQAVVAAAWGEDAELAEGYRTSGRPVLVLHDPRAPARAMVPDWHARPEG